MVTLIYGHDAEEMVRNLIPESELFNKLLHRGDRVMIKPNLVVSRPEWIGVNTDPKVVEALVKVLKEGGISRITVGDGSGMGYNATKAFEVCGYRDLAKRYGLRLVDLERDTFADRDVKIDGPFETLQIAKTALECDFLINVPVMKAHMETLITCSLKNMKGVMPRAMKTAFHGVDLHRAIAQLASVISPDMILVDGLQGDLYSETGRNPVAMEMMIFGANPVEVDSKVADILGYEPRGIRHIAHSADGGIGTCNLEGIRIQSLNRPSRAVRFRPPPHYSERSPCEIHIEGACCTCTGNLMFALERLREHGMLRKNQDFVAGQKATPSGVKGKTSIAVGQCAATRADAEIQIPQCPPTANSIYRCVAERFMNDRAEKT